MKKKFARSILVFLCIALFLSACSVKTPDSNTHTPQQPVTPHPEYEKIIGNIIRAYPWNADDQTLVPENPELSYMYRHCSALSDIGFALLDLDQNGQMELLISDPKQEYVYDLYTLANRQAVHLLASGERSRYYMRENGFVEHQWSGGAGLTGHDFYKLENGVLRFVERITMDVQHAVDLGIINDISQANEVDTYFKSQSTQHLDYLAITSEEAESAIQAYQTANKALTITYTPLSVYSNNSAESSDSHVVITQYLDFTYSYEITDYAGKVLERIENLSREPHKQYVRTDVVGICIQTGTGLSTNYAKYYDLENSAVSEVFYYVLTAKDGYVVYVDYKDEEHYIVIQDIFDKDQYCKEYKLENTSPVAADVAVEGYFQADGNVCITYWTGDDYTETKLTIPIP